MSKELESYLTIKTSQAFLGLIVTQKDSSSADPSRLWR